MDYKQEIITLRKNTTGYISSLHSAMKRVSSLSVTNFILPALVTPKLIIMSHYDVVYGSSGYNDNGSGIVVNAHLIKTFGQLDFVEFVFTDGEERGGAGSSAYCENLVLSNLPTQDIQAINLDVIGLPDKIFFEEYGQGKLLINTGRAISYPGIPFSDSHILKAYGIKNVLFLTGKDSNSLIADIWVHQHNGKLDGIIDELDNTIMEKVFQLCSLNINKFNSNLI